jgi:hypothetical protein
VIGAIEGNEQNGFITHANQAAAVRRSP